VFQHFIGKILALINFNNQFFVQAYDLRRSKHPPSADGTLFSKEGRAEVLLLLLLSVIQLYRSKILVIVF